MGLILACCAASELKLLADPVDVDYTPSVLASCQSAEDLKLLINDWPGNYTIDNFKDARFTNNGELGINISYHQHTSNTPVFARYPFPIPETFICTMWYYNGANKMMHYNWSLHEESKSFPLISIVDGHYMTYPGDACFKLGKVNKYIVDGNNYFSVAITKQEILSTYQFEDPSNLSLSFTSVINLTGMLQILHSSNLLRLPFELMQIATCVILVTYPTRSLQRACARCSDRINLPGANVIKRDCFYHY